MNSNHDVMKNLSIHHSRARLLILVTDSHCHGIGSVWRKGRILVDRKVGVQSCHGLIQKIEPDGNEERERSTVSVVQSLPESILIGTHAKSFTGPILFS